MQPITRSIVMFSLIAAALVVAVFLYPHAKQKEPAWSRTQTRPSGTTQPVIAIVPHHAVAGALVEKTLAAIPTQSYQRIVLICTNHFNQGRGFVQTTDRLGQYPVDQSLVQEFIDTRVASLEPDSFVGEHGIESILPHLSHRYPNVSVAPLLIADNTPTDRFEALTAALHTKYTSGTLFVLSADFSHYLTSQAAQFHDNYAKDVLLSGQWQQALNVDVDSPIGLALVMRLAEKKQMGFTLVGNQNSAQIADNPFAPEPTSYVAGFYSGSKDGKTDPITTNLLFVGKNVMRDWQQYCSIESMQTTLGRLVSGSDVVIGRAPQNGPDSMIGTCRWNQQAETNDNQSEIISIDQTENQTGFVTKRFLLHNDNYQPKTYCLKNKRQTPCIVYSGIDTISIQQTTSLLAEMESNQPIVFLFQTHDEKVLSSDIMSKAQTLLEAGARLVITDVDHALPLVTPLGGSWLISIAHQSNESGTIEPSVGMTIDEHNEIIVYLVPIMQQGSKREVLWGRVLKQYLEAAAQRVEESFSHQVSQGILVVPSPPSQ